MKWIYRPVIYFLFIAETKVKWDMETWFMKNDKTISLIYIKFFFLDILCYSPSYPGWGSEIVLHMVDFSWYVVNLNKDIRIN